MGTVNRPTFAKGFQPATAMKPGVAGLVPPATVADAGKFLRGDGTWQKIKFPAVVTLSSNYVLLSSEKTSDTVKIIDTTGVCSVESSDTTIATCSLFDSTITITKVSEGTTMIAVTILESEDYFENTYHILVEVL